MSMYTDKFVFESEHIYVRKAVYRCMYIHTYTSSYLNIYERVEIHICGKYIDRCMYRHTEARRQK